MWSASAQNVNWVESCRVLEVNVPEEVYSIHFVSASNDSPDQCGLSVKGLTGCCGFSHLFFGGVTFLQLCKVLINEQSLQVFKRYIHIPRHR